MRKVSFYKCPQCGRKFKKLNGWIRHVEEEHPKLIPDDMTPTQYFYYLQTGKKEGKCVVCGRPTKWIEQSAKYTRMCDDPKCKEKLREEYRKNMIAKKGTDNLFADPEFQKKCLKNRRISGTVKWWDGGEFDYVGSYEKDWQLNVLSGFMQWPSCDWIIPSPHIYKYMYEGKEHFYIPDAYCVSMDTEFERKDDNNMHPKIQKVDRVKDQLKEKAVRASGKGYCKIAGKDNYADFFNYLLSFKDKNTDFIEKPSVAAESIAITELIDDDLYTLSTEKDSFNNKNLYVSIESALHDKDYEGGQLLYVFKSSGEEVVVEKATENTLYPKTSIDLKQYGTIRFNADKTYTWIERPLQYDDCPVCESFSMIDYEKYLEENGLDSICMESVNTIHKLFHLSTQSNITKLNPIIPKNFLTENGYEDAKTKRVCFSSSIDLCLRAMSQNLKDKEFYVYVPISNNLKIKTPSLQEVPDAKVTGEVWSLDTVQVQCIGKIKVTKAKDTDGVVYNYGDKTATLYDWDWNYIERYNESALEAISNIDIAKEENIFMKGALISTKWFQSFGFTNTIKGAFKSLFVKVKIKNNMISIKGIDNDRLVNRINDMYEEKRLTNILEKDYTWLSLYNYKAKNIKKSQMKVKKLYTNEFFTIELIKLFKDLGERYKDLSYIKVAKAIYDASWLKKADTTDVGDVDMSNLSKMNQEYTLKHWQSDFVRNYKRLKSRLNLNGYILAFDPGLGKTLTSIALATCLEKEKVYIICPNSLKDNWAIEIRNYFNEYKADEDLWKKEVGIVGNSKFPITDDTKYLICNLEAISKFMPYADASCDNMLIIDESQNFRNIKGTRTEELLKFAKALNCKDIIPCSGTPVKANPAEIVPCLALLDPTFTQKCGEIYSKCFNMDTLNAANIINNRFGNIMYRRTKQEIGSLPQKYEVDLFVTTNNSEQYLVSHTNKLIQERFEKIYIAKIEKNRELRKQFIEEHNKYSNAPRDIRKLYEKNVINVVNTNKVTEPLADVDKDTLETYIDTFVFPNVPQNRQKDFKRLYTNFIMMEKQAMGEAMGEILPKYRAQMFIDMYAQNKMQFINKINENTKKVVIFSPFLEVVKYIYNDMKASGIGIVKITGEDKDRIKDIIRFKEDDTIQVLIATSQTLGTGVTLTEANILYFFGTPWRSTDYKQASDRIHRIGQTDDVIIYNVLLKSEGKNLSTRMQEILSWSDEMFNGLIDNGQVSDLTALAVESYVDLVKCKRVYFALSEDMLVDSIGEINRSFIAFDSMLKANRWALYQKLISIKDEYREVYGEVLETGWDFINAEPYVHLDQLEKIKTLLGKNFRTYIYWLDINDDTIGRNEISNEDSKDIYDALGIINVEYSYFDDKMWDNCALIIGNCDGPIYSRLLEDIYEGEEGDANKCMSAMIINLISKDDKMYKDIYVGKIYNVDIDKFTKKDVSVNDLEKMKLCTEELFTIGAKKLSNVSKVFESLFESHETEINLVDCEEIWDIVRESVDLQKYHNEKIDPVRDYKVELLDRDYLEELQYKHKLLKDIRYNDRSAGMVIINERYDEVVGVLVVEDMSMKSNDNNQMITNLTIDSAYRSQGIGEYLFDRAMTQYGANHVLIRKDNHEALNLCNKKGWKVIEENEKCYRVRPKEYVDAHPMMESVGSPKVETSRGTGLVTGFTHNGKWNGVIEVDRKNYRYRVETIVINKNDPTKIYVDLRSNKYRLPGGSVEVDVPNIKQAENEVNEEALLNVTKLEDSGYRYFVDYQKTPLWQADLPIQYAGYYCEVFVAMEDGVFRGKVAESDRDESMHVHGRYFSVEKLKNILRPEHYDAYTNYVTKHGLVQETKVEAATEAKLTAKERNALKDEAFGLPSQRKYPLIDESHIRDAIAYFHFCNVMHRKELAENIMKAIKNQGLEIEIGEKSLIRKYVTIEE